MADFNYADEAGIITLATEIRKRIPSYAVCSTPAATAAKAIGNLTGFDLRAGATIRIKFTYGNTASDPTLNVNNTGAKNIFKHGTDKPGDSAKTSWQDDSIVTMTYDGTAWYMNAYAEDVTMMEGATSTTPGTSGYVPAPAVGDQDKVLLGDGTWGDSPGAKKYEVTGTVTNVSGSYTQVFEDDRITPDTEVDRIELGNPEVFDDKLHFVCGNGTITLTCNSVAGASSIKMWCQKAITDPTAISESVFDKPLNKRLNELNSSVIKTINGRAPSPVTGDITIIEGGGSSSYGSYRLDAVISETSWTGEGPYTATVSNQYITSNMDGTETWLDDGTAILGVTTFVTSDQLLTITTSIKPTAAWNLHISLAVNGADMLADLSGIKEDLTDAKSAIANLNDRRELTSGSDFIYTVDSTITISTLRVWRLGPKHYSLVAQMQSSEPISSGATQRITFTKLENYTEFNFIPKLTFGRFGTGSKYYLNYIQFPTNGTHVSFGNVSGEEFPANTNMYAATDFYII